MPEVLETLSAAPPPQIPGLHPALWRVMRTPLAAQQRLATIGLLPRDLRHRLGVRWTRRDARRFRAMAAASRASGPLMVGPLREFGPHYVRFRRAALARGDVAGRPAVANAA